MYKVWFEFILKWCTPRWFPSWKTHKKTLVNEQINLLHRHLTRKKAKKSPLVLVLDRLRNRQKNASDLVPLIITCINIIVILMWFAWQVQEGLGLCLSLEKASILLSLSNYLFTLSLLLVLTLSKISPSYIKGSLLHSRSLWKQKTNCLWGGTLREDTRNGRVEDYIEGCKDVCVRSKDGWKWNSNRKQLQSPALISF